MSDYEYPSNYDEFGHWNASNCTYLGTEFIETKIYLIGVFATFIALLSIAFNSFFALVFVSNESIRKSPVFYFGILAIIDALMAINYCALMTLPVYMDYFDLLWLYHIFLWYFRVGLTESNSALFASLLMILLATTERLLKTAGGTVPLYFRKKLEHNRLRVSLVCIAIAIAYKASMYWEIALEHRGECSGWEEYEIVPGWLTQIPEYRFWWMVVVRNVVDRIVPFFLLVAMNYFVIKALKKEYKRQAGGGKMSLNDRSTKSGRRSLRDATRALISVVSMYLLSQSPQIVLTVWEFIDRAGLESNYMLYSYMNDVLSILTLLSSCVRFPMYCSCNRQIYEASRDTLLRLRDIWKSTLPRKYRPILASEKTLRTSTLDDNVHNIYFDAKRDEWRL